MKDIFAELSYPFDDPQGVELRRLISELFMTNEEALDIAQQAGLKRYKLTTTQPAYYLWKQILEMSSSEQRLRKLVETAAGFLHQEHPSLAFFRALLAQETPVLTAQLPRNKDGSTTFIDSNDLVTRPEALLYFDDLTLQIGRIPALINSLQLLQQLAPAVCHLLIDFNGLLKHGTGFRIGHNLLLTNWHVVHDDQGTPATTITAEFGHEDDGQGGFKNTVKLPCRQDNVVAHKDDDWAVITVSSPLDAAWPIIQLSDAVDPELNTPAYIIQHPEGQSKRIGFVRNQVADYTDRVVHYLTDTQVGSSGAPVFNAAGRLIALHHAGGRAQQIPGKPPVKKNEGIRIARILKGLQEQSVTIA
jgi:V8-like Glu-specific endopeptidase